MLNDLSLNIPLLDAWKKMLEYARFIKELVTKKLNSRYEDIGGLFMILYTIGTTRFTRAFSDLEPRINLIPQLS